MIIDTSAIIAILRDEKDATSYARAIADATDRRVSAVNFVESAVVIDASGDPIATRRFDDFMKEANISVEQLRRIRRRLHDLPIAILERAAAIPPS